MRSWRAHADFSLEAFSLPGADAPDGMLTCYPHRMKGEGHFVALLRKHGDAPCNWQKAPEKDAPSPRTHCKPCAPSARWQTRM